MGEFSLIFSYIFRDIWRNKTLFLLILSGLAMSSIAILLTMGILNGFQAMFVEGERGWLGDIIISPGSDKRNISQSVEIENKLSSMDQVEAFSKRSHSQGIIRYEEKKATSFRVIGVEPENDDRVTWLRSKIIEGNFFEEGKSGEAVILGRILADGLIGTTDDGIRVRAGEDVFLLSPDGSSRRFRVQGIIDAKTFFPNWSIFIEKNELEKIDPRERNAQIVVKLRDPKDLEEIKSSLKAEFPQVIVRSWEEESEYVKDIMQAVRFITLSIRNLLILAVFVIISIVIYINVNQKKRQIGIMKSMGVSNFFIITAYFLESFFYVLFSYPAGLVIFFLIYFWMDSHPVYLLIGDFRLAASSRMILLAFASLLLSSVFGSLLPSIFAARTRIIEVMRGNL